ncbi:MAG TPA: polyprenyl synthetase family protein [Candidatus Binatia bacterium]|nr:polyprenyl synthetase family protein [Candidatus Binatia bacterium]
MANHLTLATFQRRLAKISRQKNATDATIEIQQYFLERKSLVDAALNQYFRRKDPQISPLLHEAVCYSVLDAGKRFRPILTLAVGELFGARRAPLLAFACAIELIHCYSLIHDDLPALDNDDFRRGKASCHKRFGEAIALLAGDALLTEAFFIVSDPSLARLLGSSLSAQLIREISASAGMRGMISGQSRELELERCEVTPQILEELDRLKTGALIITAARVGALIGGSARKDLDRITRYAQCLGLIFQITDDILDEHETADAHKGLTNYLSVAGKAKARERVQSLFAQCLRVMEPYGKAAEPLREIARYVTDRKQ